MVVQNRRHAAFRPATAVELTMPKGQLSTTKVEQLVIVMVVLKPHAGPNPMAGGKHIVLLTVK